MCEKQECRYPPRLGNSSCEGDWFGCIQSHLGPAYIKMAGLSLLSIRLIIMVRREHYYKISSIEVLSLSLCFAGLLPYLFLIRTERRLQE